MSGDWVLLEITCADSERLFSNLCHNGILLRDVKFISPLTLRCRIDGKDLHKVNFLGDRQGFEVKILKKYGIRSRIFAMMQRRLLVAGMALLMVCSILLPGRILILEVEGNQTVDRRTILEAAANCGIGFFASTREIRSEKMKNELLGQIPELKWAAINLYGCRGVIQVMEREAEDASSSIYANIVAATDGVITSCTATKGTPLVKPGEGVTKGQILINGYLESDLRSRFTGAEGEVFAQTSRKITVKTDPNQLITASTGQQKQKFSLLIGKKRINFYKGSGICDAGCVKMYWKYVLTLPGRYSLPVALVCEQIQDRDLRSTEVDITGMKQLLSDTAKETVKDRMIAGTVLDSQEETDPQKAFVLYGHYTCQEMIGRGSVDQIGVYHGKTD